MTSTINDVINYNSNVDSRIRNKTAPKSISLTDEADSFSDLSSILRSMMPNQVITGMGITAVSGSAVVQPGSFQVAGVIYSPATVQTFALPAQDEALSRISIVYSDASGNLNVASGDLSSSPVAPAIPPGSFSIGVITVSPSAYTVTIPAAAVQLDTQTPQAINTIFTFSQSPQVPAPIGPNGAVNVSSLNASISNAVNTYGIVDLTTTGDSGVASYETGTLNIPNYTLAGLGGQPQLNGNGFVKATGTNISYDNSTYLTTISGIEAGGDLTGTYPNPTVNTINSITKTYYDPTSSIQTQLNGKQPSGNYITALTGDGAASGPGSAAFTLATVNSNTGAFGSSTQIPTFTVNAKGLITAASGNAVIAPAGTLSGTTLNSTVVNSSLTSAAGGAFGSNAYNSTAYALLAAGINTFTTTGTSGAATFASNTLNIPNYTLAGLGGMPSVGGTFTGDVQQATLPVNGNSLVNQGYVLGLINGLNWKHSVTITTTTTLPAYTVSPDFLTLTASSNGAFPTTDGITLVLNNTILVKNETGSNKTNHGSYTLTQVGNGSTPWILVRTSDSNTSTQLLGATYLVLSGTVQSNQVYTVNVDPIILGTTQITLALTAGPNTYINGTGLSLTANVFSINSSYVSTGSVTGYLLNTDWTTFNNKQAQLSGTGLLSFSGTTPSYNTTSASILAIISDATGTNKLVFSTSPTFVTPTLGVATATQVYITGTGTIGTAYINLAGTGGAPGYATPPTGSINIFQANGSGFGFRSAAGFSALISNNLFTGDRFFTLPDQGVGIFMLALNPNTTTGDITYQSTNSTTGTGLARLPGNTSATMKFLTSTGTGTTANSPVYTDLFGSNNIWGGNNTFTNPIMVGSNSITPTATTDIYGTSDNLFQTRSQNNVGVELITLATDRNFSGGAGNWTLGSGWTVSGGVATVTSSTAAILLPLTALTSSSILPFVQYLVTITPSYTSGTANINISLNGGIAPSVGTTILQNGTYQTIVTAGILTLGLSVTVGNSSSTWGFTNVSIKPYNNQGVTLTHDGKISINGYGQIITTRPILSLFNSPLGVGTMSVSASGTTVTLSMPDGTINTGYFATGDQIAANGEVHTVSAITAGTNNTLLLTTDAWTSAFTGTYTKTSSSILSINDIGNTVLNVRGGGNAFGINNTLTNTTNLTTYGQSIIVNYSNTVTSNNQFLGGSNVAVNITGTNTQNLTNSATGKGQFAYYGDYNVNSGATGTFTNNSIYHADLLNFARGVTLTNAWLYRSALFTNSGTITNMVGVNTPVFTGGTITNQTHFLAGQTTAPTGNWAYHNATGLNNYLGSGKNYINAVSDDGTTAKLQVTGNAAANFNGYVTGNTNLNTTFATTGLLNVNAAGAWMIGNNQSNAQGETDYLTFVSNLATGIGGHRWLNVSPTGSLTQLMDLNGSTGSVTILGSFVPGAPVHATSTSGVYVYDSISYQLKYRTAAELVADGGGSSNPMTTLGDMIYGGASGVPTRLAGTTSSNMKFLASQGSSGVATAPAFFDLFNSGNNWFASNQFQGGIGIGNTSTVAPISFTSTAWVGSLYTSALNAFQIWYLPNMTGVLIAETSRGILKGQTVAQTLTTYTTPADGIYRVEVSEFINSLTVDTFQISITYTDIENNSRTVTGSIVTTNTWGANWNNCGLQASNNIFAKGGTTITINATLPTGTGSINYDVAWAIIAY